MFVCARCGAEAAAEPSSWACPVCGGPLELPPEPLDPAARLTGEGLWRYRAWLGVPGAITLGEPTTPLLPLRFDGLDFTSKLEGSLPSGSFKDRGAAVLVSWLAARGVRHVADDSSGNAGAALAAYCARAGIACDIYVPESTAPAKLRQIEAYGARLVRVPGPRSASTDAVLEAASHGVVYATHAGSPLYLAGTQTFAFELWEQLGRRAPDVLVMPVGGGSLFLGALRGFRALREAGLIERVPRLVGVQVAACAPLARAAAAGRREPVTVDPAPSAAQGILIVQPLRGESVLAAADALLEVEEEALAATHERLARGGLFVEPTSAVPFAAIGDLLDHGLVVRGEAIVVAATGHGLKTPADPRG